VTVSDTATCRFVLSHVSAKDPAPTAQTGPGFVRIKSFRPRSDTRYLLGPAGPVLIEKQH
jgi:hypothetical protein